MIIKRIVKDIKKIGLANVVSGGGNKYIGISPMVVNNENNTIAINKQDLLSDTLAKIEDVKTQVDRVNNYAQENGVKISDIEASQEKQNTLIAKNTSQITTNKNELEQLYNQVLDRTQDNKRLIQETIEGIRLLKPFKYVGEFDTNLIYKTNEVVSINNTLYLSKIDNNNYIPPNDKYWLLINSPLNIDLSPYATKLELEDKANQLATKESFNELETKVNQNTNKVLVVENNLQETNKTLNNVKSRFQSVETNVGNMTHTLSEFERKINANINSINSLVIKDQELNELINLFENDSRVLSQRIDRNVESIKSNTNKISPLESKISSLESTINSLKSTINSLEPKLNNLNKLSDVVVLHYYYQDGYVNIMFRDIYGNLIAMSGTFTYKAIGRYTDVGTNENGTNTSFVSSSSSIANQTSSQNFTISTGEYSKFPVCYKWVNASILAIHSSGKRYRARITVLTNEWRDYDYLADGPSTGIIMTKIA